jgi:hypothetical protein
MVRTERARAIEAEATRLRDHQPNSIAFKVWDAEFLSAKLKSHPQQGGAARSRKGSLCATPHKAQAYDLLMQLVGMELNDWPLAAKHHKEWLGLVPGDPKASQWAPILASRARRNRG